MRKIVHIDMDAFYASVEQRHDPSLLGKPVVVGGKGLRSVVLAASYEAREFGIRSAMPGARAHRLCPHAEFVRPDFSRYKQASSEAREIFERYTDRIEPLSLDEAYLDVTENRLGLSATEVARAIRDDIRSELRLTASAGIAPNKFLAKIASDWRKPDGQFVIRPAQVEAFLEPLPVAKIPGVGKVMNGKLEAMGVISVGDLRALERAALEERFGRYGLRLHELARGIDERPVQPNQPAVSVSAEDTFGEDLPLTDLEPMIRQLAEKAWNAAIRKAERRVPRTVVLKLKTRDFHILTRSLTPLVPPADLEQFTRIALDLRARVDDGGMTRYRLVGVGVTNFREPVIEPQAELFDSFD